MNSTIKNTLELSVSDLSVSIKNLIEDNFGYVRVKERLVEYQILLLDMFILI